MTLWKLRFALEYCRKSRGIEKNQAKTMILNGYKQSKLTILIRRSFKRFMIYNNANKKVDLKPNWWFSVGDSVEEDEFWKNVC